ncbi:MAG TPA: TonB-dependent receptor, partial [Bryobacteraceae bacterium]|nr:TonB-dependent receptor [Bryobacteraceae bacterium]
QVTTKLDQELASWWRASASYLHYGSREESNAWFGYGNPATPGQSMLVRHVDATQANTTLTPTPTTVVYLRWGFNRYPNTVYQLASQGFDLAKLGFPSSLVSQLPYDAFPATTMSDLSSYGAGGYSSTHYYSRSFSGTVSKFMGRHEMKAGFDYRAIHVAGTPTVTPGAYSFSSVFTGSTNTTVPGSGSSLASMLLGYPASGSVTTSDPISDVIDYYGVFFQDDFRITPKLTLNLGLRYEYETGLKSPTNTLIAGFNPSVANPIQSQVSGITTNGVLEYAGQNGYGNEATHPTGTKFGPRVGFAYALDSKTTIRGGYGLFWAPFAFSLYTPIGYTQSTPYVASNDNSATPAGTLSNPFPSGVLAPAGNSAGSLAGIGGQSFTIYDANASSTRVHMYSFDVQHDFGAGFVVAAGYSGSITHNLIQGTPSININQLPDSNLALGSKLNTKVANPFYGTSGGILNLASPTITQAQLLLPYPEFGTISEIGSDQNHARYNSFYLKVQKRLSGGLNLLSSYTWSKNMDASNAASNTFNAQQTSPQDNYNQAAEWSLATINTPSRWTTAINYQLPFGKGRHYLNSNRLVDLVAGGWSMNAQTTMQTGFPLAIYQANQNSVIGTSTQRPNATGASPETSGSLESRLASYINTSAFSLAPAFTYGNAARTIPMRGPGMANIDFSMFKTFDLYERFKAQFRAEVFNLTNTPQFYGPNTQFGSSTFGQITSQANFPRVFQLGVRFYF